MACNKTIMVVASMLVAVAPAAAQQLENSRTGATSGTVATGMQGRSDGANLSAGGKGPASETQMAPPKPQTNGRARSAVQAGASDPTKEMYEH